MDQVLVDRFAPSSDLAADLHGRGMKLVLDGVFDGWRLDVAFDIGMR